VCQRAPGPIIINGSLNAGDVQQAGRITRDGSPSTCTGSTAALENNVAVRRDTHVFSNPFNETVCVRVEQDFSGCGQQTQSVAYSSYNPAFPANNVIGDAGFSTINKGSYFFSVGPNASFSIVVNEIDPNTGCAQYQLKISYLRNCRQGGFDRTNDGKADPTVYETSTTSQWRTLDSDTNQLVTRSFGTVGDLTLGGGDYTGDGRTDLSVFRQNNSTWYHGIDEASPGTNFGTTPFGTTGDRPVPGDYDGDGTNDFAVWRPANGDYYVLRSSDGAFQAFHWGVSTDRSISGDFDGDTITDFSVARPTSGGLVWLLQKSNYNYGFDEFVQWGLSTDKAVPADYDGDGKTDLAVWRPSDGTFYVRRSSDLNVQAFKWGIDGDIPQPADYDGDGKADFAVYRGTAGEWYIYYSATGTLRIIQLGGPGQVAVSAAYRIQ
jgi:hypothetical protein